MTPLENPQIPLCVDMDGTLIREDVTQIAFLQLISRDILALAKCVFWLMRGRAYMKSRIEAATHIDLTKLTYHAQLIAFIREQKSQGRKIVLATAADFVIAKRMADHLKLFDEVIASDGSVNKRAQEKAKALHKAFPNTGYVYAGNSRDDLKVWPHAQAIIAVNCSDSVLEAARAMNKPIRIFPRFP